ncbi:MAG: (4Fe-4S)-binding protein [Flavobacteriales bacterium]|nr:(4Fe-4S)-binding protein [Flavobacteriales bacterium]
MANVFQPKSKPWINAEGASSEEIEAQVNSARLVRWQRIETQMENRLRNHQEQQPLS